LRDALKLNPKLAILRVSESLEFAEPLFQRRHGDADVARPASEPVRHSTATDGALGLRSHGARGIKLSNVVWIDCGRLRSEARDQIHEVLQKDRKEVARCLVYEVSVSIELFVRVCDENLRLKKGVCVCEYECLPQLGLASRGSRHPRRGSHHGGCLTVQRAIARRPGQPVDRVLQYPWNAVVVLGTCDQQAIGSADRVTQLNDSCWCGDTESRRLSSRRLARSVP
jgi:hypothetical protein